MGECPSRIQAHRPTVACGLSGQVCCSYISDQRESQRRNGPRRQGGAAHVKSQIPRVVAGILLFYTGTLVRRFVPPLWSSTLDPLPVPGTHTRKKHQQEAVVLDTMRTHVIRCAVFLALGGAEALQPGPTTQWLRARSPARPHAAPARHAPSVLHGGGHHHHAHAPSDAAATPFSLRPASLVHYMRTEVVRPLLVHFILAWSTLQRHTIRRNELKKAEFEEHASRITWIGAAVNFVLAFFKLAAGIQGRSAAMVADAAHSFSDLISDALTLIALRMSALPADVDHPYGHGRFESVGSLAIGALLIGAGTSFCASSVQALTAPAVTPLGSIALWAAIVSIVSKEVLFRATARIGERLKSQVLMANAWHHRSDALSSVVAVVGIAGSLMGWRFLDPLAGVLVAGMVSWMGIRISIEALGQLTDTSDYGVVQAVESVAREVEGVNSVDHIRSRSMGGSSLVDLAIQVDPKMSASSAHRLAEEVRLRVMDDASELADEPISEVLVHVDTAPHDSTCPLQTSVMGALRSHTAVEADVRSELLLLPEVTAVPRVQVFYLDGGLAVEAQCRMLEHLTVSELREVAKAGQASLKRGLPDSLVDVSIGLDLGSAYVETDAF